MNNRLISVALGLLAAWLAIMACTIGVAPPPSTDTPTTSQEDLASTAAALVLTAQAPATATSTPEATVSAEPTATECQPTVTANLNANVRSGPGTGHSVVGSLTDGESASVVGRNDESTWWYIEHGGGHAWIAASVTTSTCIPDDLAVVAGPTLPETGEPPAEDTTEEEPAAEPPAAAMPDLQINQFTISPETPTAHAAAHARVQVYNYGDAAAGAFAVHWYGLSTYGSPSCTWNVASLAAHGGRVLQCDFSFPSWYPVDRTSLAVADPANQVDESDEGNNEATISPFGVSAP
jgi:CARDB/Bacterial SH3 domain